jgi:hypothetical protein
MEFCALVKHGVKPSVPMFAGSDAVSACEALVVSDRGSRAGEAAGPRAGTRVGGAVARSSDIVASSGKGEGWTTCDVRGWSSGGGDGFALGRARPSAGGAVVRLQQQHCGEQWRRREQCRCSPSRSLFYFLSRSVKLPGKAKVDDSLRTREET